MLTSSANQYLRPEYLTPLPTTLDAKKSPLALLAQTCSQIGADPSSTNKALLGPLDKSSSSSSSSKSCKSSSSDQPREKSSPVATESVRTSFKPYESCLGREKASSPEEPRSSSSHSTSARSRTPGNGNKRCPSNQSVSSTRAATPQGRRTATPNGDVTRDSPVSRTSLVPTTSGHVESSSGHPVAVSSPSLQVRTNSYSPAGMLAMADPSIKDLPLGTFKPGVSLPSSTSPYLGYTTQLPIDVMASSLMSQHHAALKNGLVSGNPYLNYARLKASSGPEALMPVCRDPYCTGCQLNSHLLVTTANGKLSSANGANVPPPPGSGCPAGCAQCDHKPGSASAAAVAAAAAAAAASSPYGPLGAAAYAHAQLAALAAASQLPYVCNWIASDTAYCGKRFSTSDELLQHLRSHTSMSQAGGGGGGGANTDPTVAALSLLSPPVGLPPTHPLFSRTYPTPPLSPLATARYHPYGKPSPLLPPSLSSLGLPLPPPHPHTAAGLPPYFSPYSFYGGPARLGAASGMHQ